jgi:hypothetical protein
MTKSSDVSASSFAWSSVNPATEIIEMLRKAFGEHPLPRAVAFNDFHVSRPVKCQLKMTNVQGDQESAKRQKMLKQFENSSTKTVAEQSMDSQTPLESTMEFARRS